VGKEQGFIRVIIAVIVVKEIKRTAAMRARGHQFHFFSSFPFGISILPHSFGLVKPL
jgi:hypothetical protein